MYGAESLSRDLLRLIVWYPLRFFVERLPPRAGFALLRGLGRLHATCAPGRRVRLDQAVGCIAPELPPAARRAQVLAAFETHYANQLSIFIFPHLARENAGEVLEIEGREHLDAALAAGRGVVLPIGHFGPTQLPLAVLGLLGYPMLQIGFLNDAGLSFIGRQVAFRLRRRYEGRIAARIVPPGPGTREALTHLRAGGVVMTTIDDPARQPAFGRHAAFDFPGGPLVAPLGAARLALATGAALCPTFLIPGRIAPYRLRLEAPLAVPAGLDKNEAATALFTELLARYAAVVRRSPGWWHLLEARGS
jgi:KDO2-lipid IV(A) lauroyltransferase